MNTEKHSEKQLQKAVKNEGLIHPSPDFVRQVMQKIEASEKATAYTPLIPVKGWLAIAATAVLCVLFSFYFNAGFHFPEWLSLKKLSGYLVPDISINFTLSGNALYGILLTLAVVLLHIPVLIARHNKTLWHNNA